METLDYSKVEKEVIDFITRNNKMVLATCSKNRVTARTVSIINQGLKIYFQTDIEFLKYRQIKENSNVALCQGNVQIEGQANGFRAQRDPKGKLKIVGLWEGSSAEKNGLQIGDEITNIALVNGNQISNITFKEYLSVLYNAEDITIRVRIVNDDGGREVELKNEAVLPKI